MADKRIRIGARLQHVYWIGGSPCCGKSSIARILAERHGLHLYTCDDEFLRHAKNGAALGYGGEIAQGVGRFLRAVIPADQAVLRSYWPRCRLWSPLRGSPWQA